MSDHRPRVMAATRSVAERELGGQCDERLYAELIGNEHLLMTVDNLSPDELGVLGKIAHAARCIVRTIPSSGSSDEVSAILVGSRRSLGRATRLLTAQAECSALGTELLVALGVSLPNRDLGRSQVGQSMLTWGERSYVMGIVNATPDSFSGDGLLSDHDSKGAVRRAVDQGLRFLDEGADIIDIGGESTRPGSDPVDAGEESARVLPVIKALRRESIAPISIDTYRADVARAALDAGADMINDVWGLMMDPEMAPLVAETGAPVVIMHNRSRPKEARAESRLGGRYVGVAYVHLMAEIINELRDQIELALQAGIAEDKIIIDPGIGFGKTVEQNLYLINHLDELRVLGYPILIGPSRKSFIGYTLDLPPKERMEGTAAAVAVAMIRGAADIVRVHDVRAVTRMARMVNAILGAV